MRSISLGSETTWMEMNLKVYLHYIPVPTSHVVRSPPVLRIRIGIDKMEAKVLSHMSLQLLAETIFA